MNVVLHVERRHVFGLLRAAIIALIWRRAVVVLPHAELDMGHPRRTHAPIPPWLFPEEES